VIDFDTLFVKVEIKDPIQRLSFLLYYAYPVEFGLMCLDEKRS